MVAIRRRQTRRTLARVAGAADDTLQPVLDAVEAADCPVGVGEIAETIGVDQPRASKLVAAAVTAGLLRREADQSDGRRALLVLTDAGTERLARVHAARREVFATAMAGWSEAEQATFAELLGRFVAALPRP
jgi:DNA-binding MarR family transcriptional regulator